MGAGVKLSCFYGSVRMCCRMRVVTGFLLDSHRRGVADLTSRSVIKSLPVSAMAGSAALARGLM